MPTFSFPLASYLWPALSAISLILHLKIKCHLFTDSHCKKCKFYLSKLWQKSPKLKMENNNETNISFFFFFILSPSDLAPAIKEPQHFAGLTKLGNFTEMVETLLTLQLKHKSLWSFLVMTVYHHHLPSTITHITTQPHHKYFHGRNTERKSLEYICHHRNVATFSTGVVNLYKNQGALYGDGDVYLVAAEVKFSAGWLRLWTGVVTVRPPSALSRFLLTLSLLLIVM